MTAKQLRQALTTLGWSQTRAAQELATGGGQQRISQWCTGKLKIPPYIGRHVERCLGLYLLVSAIKDGDELVVLELCYDLTAPPGPLSYVGLGP